MSKPIRIPIAPAARAAYGKPESKRSARDWNAIHQFELDAATQMATVALIAAYEELADAYRQHRTTIRENKAFIAELLRLLHDHPAAAELQRRAAEQSARQRQRARKPRSRTQKLRAIAPEYLRADCDAWIRMHGTKRGFITAKARALGVSPKTLQAHLKRGASRG